jgi:hypothetical protein
MSVEKAIQASTMTHLLQQAFSEASKLTEAEQNVLAARLLDELAAEDDFDRKIAATTDKLSKMAKEALDEHRRGLTEELDPDQL